MDIQVQVYAQKDLFSLLGVTNHQWRYHKEALLDHFRMFFDFEIFKGNNNATFFNITFVYNTEYFPLPKQKKSLEIKNHYWTETKKIIKEEPCNTGLNIAKNITLHENKYDHAERTVYNYVRPMLKDTSRVQVKEKVWCKKSEDNLHWVPLSEQEEKSLRTFFVMHFNATELLNTIGEIESHYEEGCGMSAAKRNEEIGCAHYEAYLNTMADFANLYGYKPKRIPKYELNAFGCDKPFTE